MSRTKLKMREYVGRFVRMTREHVTMGGIRFPKGTVFKVDSQHRGRLGMHLPHQLPSIAGMGILRVRPFDVELVTGRHCRVCGCTEADCRGCVERTGEPCTWVGPNLCSACASEGEERPCR